MSTKAFFKDEFDALQTSGWNEYKSGNLSDATYSKGSWKKFQNPSDPNVANRANTPWRNAQIVMVEIPDKGSITSNVLEVCKKLCGGQEGQRIVFKNTKGVLKVFDIQDGKAKKIQDILDVVKALGGSLVVEVSKDKPAVKLPIQKIIFGAPGTGKSYKVSKMVQEKLSYEEIETQFFEYLTSVPTLKDDRTPASYKTYFRNIHRKTGEKLYEMRDPDEISNLSQKHKNVWDSSHMSQVVTHFINFVSGFPEVYRTTFHPDYDYAQFVGALKPSVKKKQVLYEYVPQVFAKAYVAAWNHYCSAVDKNKAKQVYLVVEEINRGNCAQIFGDVFQLLDRDENGFSRYAIDADYDLAKWLGCEKIKLPPNFNILATMNTSDQSLFPMDSAFKRRFDWDFVPIRYNNDGCGEEWCAHQYRIDFKLGDKNNPEWLSFLEKINKNIIDSDDGCEDKQIGEFFLKPSDGIHIDLDTFKSKVLFYLWDVIYKDLNGGDSVSPLVFHFKNDLYQDENEGEEEKVSFNTLYKYKDKGEKLVAQIMDNLKVAPAYGKDGELVSGHESYVNQLQKRPKSDLKKR